VLAAERVLASVQKIAGGALVMELAAVAVLAVTIVAYDYQTSRDSVQYFY